LLEGEGMSLILALLLPLSVAFLAVSWCWPEARRLRDRFVLKLSLAFGLASGLCSCSFFVKLVLFPLGERGYILAETALLLVLLTALAASLRIGGPGSPPRDLAPTADLPVVWRGVLCIGFALAVAVGLAGAITWLVLSPHGDWDGWVIWNTHARFLYRGGEHWADYVTKLEWTHPDYPLMMPANLARLWTYVGRESQFEHRLLDLMFLLATGGLLGGALARLRGRSQGLLAIMILATTPLFLEKGSSQYSDIPLGYFVLATGVLLCLHEAAGGCRRLVVLAGAAAGFAAWTKNEGVMFLLAVLTARLIVVVRVHGPRAWVREQLAFGLGLIPALACLAYFKANLAPTNDLMAGQGLGPTIERLLSPSRYMLIASAYALQTRLIGPGSVVAMAVYYVLLGKAAPAKHCSARNSCLLVLAFMLAGYAVIFLITPHDLSWHLTVLDRLFMQVWPLAVFTFFLSVSTPEEALGRKAVSTEANSARRLG
jgi:hypothetical protein